MDPFYLETLTVLVEFYNQYYLILWEKNCLLWRRDKAASFGLENVFIKILNYALHEEVGEQLFWQKYMSNIKQLQTWMKLFYNWKFILKKNQLKCKIVYIYKYNKLIKK